MTSSSRAEIIKFSTEVPSEVRNLEWELKNFKEIAEVNEALVAAKLNFMAGDCIGIPSKWLFSMDIRGSYLVIYLTLTKSPELVEQIFASFELVIKGTDGSQFLQNATSPINMKADKAQQVCIGKLDNLEQNAIVDGSLILNLRFKIYNHKAVHTRKSKSGTEIMQLRSLSRSVVADDMLKILNNGLHPDVVIKMKDSKTFHAHRLILAARSPVFLAMFESGMVESATKSVHVNDMSSEAMGVLLRHIYSGSLDDDWIPVAEEIVNAAEKYNLPQLKNFCDQMLVSACTTETASDFLKLAKLHGLKVAAKDIMDYIKENIGTIFGSLLVGYLGRQQ